MSKSKTPKATKPMSETAKFLSDVLITAVEGGIGYWSVVGNYRTGIDWSKDTGEEREDTRRPASVEVYEMDEDAGGYKSTGVPVSNKEIAKAFKLIMGKDEIKYCDRNWRKRMAAAYWAKDACDLDAGDADAVVQIALFGEVVYG